MQLIVARHYSKHLTNIKLLPHLITVLKNRFCVYPHFIDMETEAKRCKVVWSYLHMVGAGERI